MGKTKSVIPHYKQLQLQNVGPKTNTWKTKERLQSTISVSSTELEDVSKVPQYMSRLPPSKLAALKKAEKERKKKLQEQQDNEKHGGEEGETESHGHEDHDNASTGRRGSASSRNSKGSRKPKGKGKGRGGRGGKGKGKPDDKNNGKEQTTSTSQPNSTSTPIQPKPSGQEPKPPRGTRGKGGGNKPEANTDVNNERETAVASPREPEPPPEPLRDELEMLDDVNTSRKMWLQLSQKNLGMFAKTAYEYDVFYEKKKEKILNIEPSVAASENFRATDKPKYFVAKTLKEGKDVFDIRYKLGNIFKRAINVEVRIQAEFMGMIVQKGKTLTITDQTNHEVMRINGVPPLGCCNTSGPDNFKCEIYLTATGQPRNIGIIGRNGSIMDKVVIGEPSGFYFILARKMAKEEFNNLHKVYILAILVVFMTIYAD